MRLFVLMLSAMASSVAWGHGVHVAESDFVSGLLHPMTGIDHVLAAAGMGLWLGLQTFTRWSIPLYCAALAAGIGLAGIWAGIGGGFAGLEWALASTLIVTGLLLYKPLHLPQSLGAAVIGVIFCCHFYAHITEAPLTSSAAGGTTFYMLGLFITTVSMTAAALAFAARGNRAVATWTRLAGAAIAAVGVTALGLA